MLGISFPGKYTIKSSANVRYINNEVCVVCSEKTTIDKRTPLDARQFYVDGVGQLCYRCYKDLHH